MIINNAKQVLKDNAEILKQEFNLEVPKNVLNKMDDETFDLFIKYHLATCERQELIGASAHTLDILKK